MTTYNAIADGEILPDDPLTSILAFRFRDNPIAFREGATGAPYEASAWHPYNGVTIGDAATGLFYDFAVHGAVPSFETPVWGNGYEYRVIKDRVAHNSGSNQQLQIELYKDSDAAYTAAAAIDTARAGSVNISGFTEILRPRILLATATIWTAAASGFGTGNFTTNASTLTGANRYSKARLSFTGGSIAGGKMYLQKRLCYF